MALCKHCIRYIPGKRCEGERGETLKITMTDLEKACRCFSLDLVKLAKEQNELVQTVQKVQTK